MSVELGTAATQDSSAFATAAQGLEADAAVKSIVAGTAVIVDNTNPQNPVVSFTGSGTGSVTNVSVATANGFLATVANPTTTPAITIETGVTGILYGNGTGVAAAVPANFPTLNQSTTGNAATSTALDGIATVAALRLVSGTAIGQAIFLEGYTTQNDGGQGQFQWGAYATDNGGTIITPTSQTAGSWYRVYPAGQVRAKWFGCIGNGTTDDTTAYGLANTFYLANGGEMIFDSGTYKVSTTPNWALAGAKVRGIGNVIILYTGTGACLTLDAGATAGTFINNVYVENIVVDGGSTGTIGVLARGIVRSFVDVKVKNLNATTGKAYNIVDCVLVTFNNPVASINEFSLTSIPYYGIYTDLRVGGGGCSANSFPNTIMEGLNTGLYLNACSKAIFSGTAEACTTGVQETSTSSDNVYIGFDMESNATVDFLSAGFSATLVNCTADKLIHFSSGSVGCAIIGGKSGNVTFDSGSQNCSWINGFLMAGGVYTNNGTYTYVINCFASSTGPITNNFGSASLMSGLLLSGAAPTAPAGDVAFGAATAATATAGAGALPAAPVAFLEINVGGTAYKIPYYNA